MIRTLLALSFLALDCTAAYTASMVAAAEHPQPAGYRDFCLRMPEECGKTYPEARPILLNDDLIHAINDLNAHYNAGIVAKTDKEFYGVTEFWTYPDEGYGDCEDYVLAKRRALHADLGIPLSNLLITVVVDTHGEGHAVLTLRTEAGDYLLDNLTDDILSWTSTDYTFRSRQSTTATDEWTKIAPAYRVTGSITYLQ